MTTSVLWRVSPNESSGFILSTHHRPTNKVTIENVFVIGELRREHIGERISSELIRKTVEKF